LKLRENQSLAAAEILSGTGPIPGLENLRQHVYFDCLKRGGADIGQWEVFIKGRPPGDLVSRAQLGIAEFLIRGGNEDQAVEFLSRIADDVPTDRLRLRIHQEKMRKEAALRMLIRDPLKLHQEAPNLEKMLFPQLSRESRLQRITALRQNSHSRMALQELDHLPGNLKKSPDFRLEKALCLFKLKQSSKALRVLPPLNKARGPEALLQARILRNRAWGRYPGRGSRSIFRRCMEAASFSVSKGVGIPGLELEVECATEAGKLDQALAGWKELNARSWHSSRRSWLGRRLAIALKDAKYESGIAPGSLPDDERCLRYHQAVKGRFPDQRELEKLSRSPIPDLYALWSLRRLGHSVPTALPLRTETSIEREIPSNIQFLFDLGEKDLASTEWRRLYELRELLPGEILAAADLENDRSRPDLTIRWLRRGFKELGSPAMEELPGEVLKLYLPLRWEESLKKAAGDAGIDAWLLAGLARQESIFHAEARSSAGALGVVQLMPGTARGHARALGLGLKPDLRDPDTNLRIGARELGRLLRVFGAVEPALAAYNGGQGRVMRWWKRWPGVENFTEHIPVPESYTYVRRVSFLAQAYRLVWAPVWDGNSQSASTAEAYQK